MVRRQVWWQVISPMAEMHMEMPRTTHLSLTIMNIDIFFEFSWRGRLYILLILVFMMLYVQISFCRRSRWLN